jgi:hypothetical protein
MNAQVQKDDRTFLRRFLLPKIILVLISLPIGTVGTALLVKRIGEELYLRREGIQARAVVVEGRDHIRWADNIFVSFPTMGGFASTWVQVDEVANFPIGATIDLLYDPRNPEVARAERGSIPRWISPGVTTFAILPFALIFGGWVLTWTFRVRRVSRYPGFPMLMTIERRVWQRSEVTLALLQPLGSASTEPVLGVSLLRGVPEFPPRTPVEVAGRPVEGGVVVLRAEGTTLWPLSTARSAAYWRRRSKVVVDMSERNLLVGAGLMILALGAIFLSTRIGSGWPMVPAFALAAAALAILARETVKRRRLRRAGERAGRAS